MRIERIRSAKDVGRWVVDQAAHGAMVFACLWLLTAEPSLWRLFLAGGTVLMLREVEQWWRKSPATKARQALEPFFIRHVDRVVDVLLGAAVGTYALSLV